MCCSSAKASANGTFDLANDYYGGPATITGESTPHGLITISVLGRSSSRRRLFGRSMHGRWSDHQRFQG